MMKTTEVLVQTVCMCLIHYLRAASEQKAGNSAEWRIWRHCADNISEFDRQCAEVLDSITEQGRAATETDGGER